MGADYSENPKRALAEDLPALGCRVKPEDISVRERPDQAQVFRGLGALAMGIYQIGTTFCAETPNRGLDLDQQLSAPPRVSLVTLTVDFDILLRKRLGCRQHGAHIASHDGRTLTLAIESRSRDKRHTSTLCWLEPRTLAVSCVEEKFLAVI